MDDGQHNNKVVNDTGSKTREINRLFLCKQNIL